MWLKLPSMSCGAKMEIILRPKAPQNLKEELLETPKISEELRGNTEELLGTLRK